jgi:hypothetical protein
VEIDDLVQRVEETFVPGEADALGETVRRLLEGSVSRLPFPSIRPRSPER